MAVVDAVQVLGEAAGLALELVLASDQALLDAREAVLVCVEAWGTVRSYSSIILKGRIFMP